MIYAENYLYILGNLFSVSLDSSGKKNWTNCKIPAGLSNFERSVFNILCYTDEK